MLNKTIIIVPLCPTSHWKSNKSKLDNEEYKWNNIKPLVWDHKGLNGFLVIETMGNKQYNKSHSLQDSIKLLHTLIHYPSIFFFKTIYAVSYFHSHSLTYQILTEILRSN